MGTTSGWPPALKGDTSPSLCSAPNSPLSMKVKLGDDADPESLTMRDPVALTVVFGFRTPLSFIVPLLRVRVTLVVFVRGTLITRALGLADVAPPVNDQSRE